MEANTSRNPSPSAPPSRAEIPTSLKIHSDRQIETHVSSQDKGSVTSVNVEIYLLEISSAIKSEAIGPWVDYTISSRLTLLPLFLHMDNLCIEMTGAVPLHWNRMNYYGSCILYLTEKMIVQLPQLKSLTVVYNRPGYYAPVGRSLMKDETRFVFNLRGFVDNSDDTSDASFDTNPFVSESSKPSLQGLLWSIEINDFGKQRSSLVRWTTDEVRNGRSIGEYLRRQEGFPCWKTKFRELHGVW